MSWVVEHLHRDGSVHARVRVPEVRGSPVVVRRPVLVQAPPVYWPQPEVIVQQPPVYYAPAPVYYAQPPVFVAPKPYYGGWGPHSHGHWRQRYRGHDGDRRHDGQGRD